MVFCGTFLRFEPSAAAGAGAAAAGGSLGRGTRTDPGATDPGRTDPGRGTGSDGMRGPLGGAGSERLVATSGASA
ncbi:MAG: hypothetical protein M5U28_17380 [Sandaracinaceae bacterium]|nr:hypothetical protein [Sandaracinaceae bacterium]